MDIKSVVSTAVSSAVQGYRRRDRIKDTLQELAKNIPSENKQVVQCIQASISTVAEQLREEINETLNAYKSRMDEERKAEREHANSQNLKLFINIVLTWAAIASYIVYKYIKS